MKVIGVVLAIVLIGVGISFLPAVKTLTTAIFSDIEDANALLTLLISVWPVIVLLFFVFGAYVLARRGR